MKVKLQAPPVEGAANEALLEFLALCSKKPKSLLRLISGHPSRHKRVFIPDVKATQVSDVLDQMIKGK